MLPNKDGKALKAAAAVGLAGTLTGIVVFYLCANAPLVLFLLPVGVLALLLALKYPEIVFALFVTAGAFKSDPRLANLSEFINLTLAFEVLTAVGLIHNIAARQLRLVFPPPGVLVPYTVLMILAWISLTYTPGQIYGADKAMRFLLITSFAFFAPSILFQRIRALQYFYIVYIALAVVMVGDVLGHMSGGAGPSKLHVALGASHIIIGRVCGMAVIALFFFFFSNVTHKLAKVSILVILLAILYEMLASGGRGPIASLVISFIAVLLVFLFRSIITFSVKKHEMMLLKTLLLLSVIFVAMILNFQNHFSNTFQRFREIGPARTGASGEARTDLYAKALNAIVEKKHTIYGLGLGGFSPYSGAVDEKRGVYPHNIFLEFGAELGLAGLLMFLWLIVQSLKMALRNMIDSNDRRCFFMNISLLAGFIFMVLNASLSGDINDNRLLFALMGAIAASQHMIRGRCKPAPIAPEPVGGMR